MSVENKLKKNKYPGLPWWSSDEDDGKDYSGFIFGNMIVCGRIWSKYKDRTNRTVYQGSHLKGLP